jgi:hypothetical protein
MASPQRINGIGHASFVADDLLRPQPRARLLQWDQGLHQSRWYAVTVFRSTAAIACNAVRTILFSAQR